MTQHPKYYKIFAKISGACGMEADELSKARQTWFCQGCGGIRRNDAPIDVRLAYGPELKESPLSHVIYLGLIWKPFLEIFDSAAVQRELLLGRAFGPDGSVLENWLTFHGRHEVIIRGSREAGYRICDLCGRTVYFAMGKRFLYPAPPADVELLSAGAGCLVLPESAFARLDLAKWRKKVYIEPVAVPDTPLDGLVLPAPSPSP